MTLERCFRIRADDAILAAIDTALSEMGLRRTRVTTIPSFVVAAHLVATTDCVGNLPGAFVRSMARTLPIEAIDIPVPLPTFTVSQSWHRRHTADAGHQFLRQSVAQTMARLVNDTTGREFTPERGPWHPGPSRRHRRWTPR
jgi:DNA-binding transcriptional LysR family regulator